MTGTHFTCSKCPRERDFAQRSRHKMSAMNKMTQCVMQICAPGTCCSVDRMGTPCAAQVSLVTSLTYRGVPPPMTVIAQSRGPITVGATFTTTELHRTHHASSYVIPLKLLLCFPHLRYCSGPTKCCARHSIPLLPLSLFLLLFTCTTVPLATCTCLWCDHQLLSHCPYMVQVDLRHVTMNMSRADMTLHLRSLHAFLYTCSHNLCMLHITYSGALIVLIMAVCGLYDWHNIAKTLGLQ